MAHFAYTFLDMVCDKSEKELDEIFCKLKEKHSNLETVNTRTTYFECTYDNVMTKFTCDF